MKSKPNAHEENRKDGRVRFLPRSLDNEYRGSQIAAGFFILLTAVTVVRSLIHIVAPDGSAQSIATMPLDSFTTNGSAALGGVSNYVMVPLLILMFVLSLVRRKKRPVLSRTPANRRDLW